ncbi:hypothetical protein A2368_01695 [Candidatus Collierbacteria bacterium RIFOXYB1_FULL_49_13]|uniref:Peptidase C39-like domain-containing protein n=1 Tax=Candidatus Collierbacteria bacterium RIFOXYB1_FULL_49_13 TaxID=1817728 RepID=A0A1F5FH29_9BACT|nr:MAG: hypothetical protein A2368_01695 [Candidatus Collierbacteria bacterium RIFOXYB1_FULL_49_13]
MLFSHLGVYVDQDEFVEATGLKHRLQQFGMTVEEMGVAVYKIYPYFTFWYKEKAEITDIETIIEEYKYPVGVEWQGVFLEDEDDDNGHYSIVTAVNPARDSIVIADPYMKFAGVDRHFTVTEFLDRWWDVNDISVFGKTVQKRDDRVLFIVTPEEVTWPESLGMTK